MTFDLIPWKRRKSEETGLTHSLEDVDNPFTELHRQMNTLFDDFFRGFEAPDWSASRGLAKSFRSVAPRIDVSEDDEEITVEADLPGLDDKDIDVSLDGNVLTIAGEKSQEREEKKKDYRVMERSYGSFRRSVTLPEGIDRDHVKAHFKKGVLNVTIPKTEKAKSERKKIDVSTG
jgi:HSP20 family protein